jgi:putative membrane protein
LGAEDSKFASEAWRFGATQIEVAKLAERNTRNEVVRRFARRLVDQYERDEQRLGRILSRKGMPHDGGAAQAFQSVVERLGALENRVFDEAFKQQVIEDHERAIAFFEEEAQQGTDRELQSFAQRRLPELCEHLTMARWLDLTAMAAISRR